jgi:hypothetical protein
MLVFQFGVAAALVGVALIGGALFADERGSRDLAEVLFPVSLFAFIGGALAALVGGVWAVLFGGLL